MRAQFTLASHISQESLNFTSHHRQQSGDSNLTAYPVILDSLTFIEFMIALKWKLPALTEILVHHMQ